MRYVFVKKQFKYIELLDYGTLSLPLQSCDLAKKILSVRRSRAVIGVANELSHLKLMTVAKDLTPGQIDKYINANVLRFFKYTKGALYLDYRLILQNLRVLPIKKHQRYVQVLAAKKKEVECGLSVLKQLNIKFSILSAEFVALIQLIRCCLTSLPSFYVLIFFQEEKFSIFVVELNYLVYKNDYQFMSNDVAVKNNQISQALALLQSLYPFGDFEHYIVLGEMANVVDTVINDKKVNHINITSTIKSSISSKILLDYYAAIGLTL
jgi:Tfp pilus assembly PilM family ATPase